MSSILWCVLTARYSDGGMSSDKHTRIGIGHHSMAHTGPPVKKVLTPEEYGVKNFDNMGSYTKCLSEY